MGARIRHWIEIVRTGFWFVPIVMLLASCVLALALLWIDGHLDPGIKATLHWAYSGGPEGARSLLSTIAGSMITAASVTFSLASVALSIASQQYGSRVLRNFMRDPITQVLLGTFISTFIYSVLVVRTIRGSDFNGGFVPAISVTVAIVLSVVSLIMLVYFIHHVSTSIQASHIVRVIAENLEEALPQIYPASTTKALDEPLEPSDELPTWQRGGQVTVTLASSGYIQSLDLKSLVNLAHDQNLVVELLVKPGDHQVQGNAVARVWGAPELSEDTMRRLIRAFILGGERTPEQDIRYIFQQLTDVIIRALSPGINDPFTAINGIDELAQGVQLMARQGRIGATRQDRDGALRLVAPVPQVAEVLEETVGHIAIYAAGDHFVMDGLRRVLRVVEPDLRSEHERQVTAHLRQELDRRQQAKAI